MIEVPAAALRASSCRSWTSPSHRHLTCTVAADRLDGNLATAQPGSRPSLEMIRTACNEVVDGQADRRVASWRRPAAQPLSSRAWCRFVW